MFKIIIFGLFFVSNVNVYAQDACLEKVKENQIKELGSGFVGLYPVSRDEVKYYIDGSMEENEKALDKMTKLTTEDNVEFYLMV